jgi:serine/threonine-protein kinase RsbT
MIGTVAAGVRAEQGLPLAAPLAAEQRYEGVAIRSETDIVAARQLGRALAIRLGFSATEATLVATAISELARNIILYAERGAIVLRPLEEEARPGILVVARDDGPGIADIRRAMTGGYSTSGGLGLGLCGVKRLVDEFEIASELGRGTTVTFKKWKG